MREERRGEKGEGRGEMEEGRREKSCAPQARSSPGNDAVCPSKRQKEGREKVPLPLPLPLAPAAAAAAEDKRAFGSVF